MLFFLHYTSHGQEKQQTTALVIVLQKLENTFAISFSYADAFVNDFMVTPPNYQKDIQAILADIEAKYPITFIAISNTSYAIKSSNDWLDITRQQNLDEVVVNGYLTEGITLNDDGSNSISPKSFGILPGLIESDILQTIQALPGVSSADERISDINIRGGTNDQNLILWEGIKMYQTGHFFGLISAFDPNLTKQVQVYKNGTSAFYGDAVSGVIDIKNSHTISNKFKGGVGLNLINADAYGIIPFNKKLELQLSVRRSLTDVWTTPTYDAYFKRVFQDTELSDDENNFSSDKDKFYFYDVSAKLIYNLSSKDRLSLSAINIANNLIHQEINTASNLTGFFNSKVQQNSLAATINYKRIWNKKIRTETQVYASAYSLDATNFDIANDQKLVQQNEVLDLGLRVYTNYTINNNLSYFGGYQFSEIGISNLEDVNNPIFRRFVKEVNRTHAIFNELKYTSNSKNTIFKIGLRTNYFEKFSKFIAEPRLTFNQKLFQHFRLEILGELKSQTTSQIIDLQNDFLGVEKRRWILANQQNIPITKSGQVSTGIHYNNNELLISAEAYLKEVRDISTRSQGFQNQFQFVDATGKYIVKGIDFLVNKKFEKISTWLSYSFSENNYTFKDLNNGNSFPNNIAIKHAVTIAGNYNWKRLKIGLGFNWRTGRPYTKPITGNPVDGNSIAYSKPNTSYLPDYFRLDFSANYNFNLNDSIRTTAGISLWNITNTINTLDRYYRLNETNTIEEIENQSLGITPNLSLRINF